MRLSLVAAAIGLILMPKGASAASRPIVIELFTSQGCSSCPPADALLTSLAGRQDILPLAFHVTYWNALGWHDPYSMDVATSRQAVYAARLGGGSYTPEMVVDGQLGVVGSDHVSVAAAITDARKRAKSAVPVRLGLSGQRLSIAIGAGGGRGRILLIGFDPRHETRVDRGENGGRTLVESNIVRSLRTVGDYAGTPIEISAPRDVGAEAAVLVQAADGRILGAARL